MVKRLTLPTRVKLYNFMEKNGVKDGKYYKYNGDLDDSKVAAIFTVSNSQVAAVRKEFGILRDRVSVKNTGLETRVEQLERRLNQFILVYNEHIAWVREHNQGAGGEVVRSA